MKSLTVRNIHSQSVNFHKDERGLSTVEYVILLVLIAVSGIGIWKTFGDTIYNKINTANDTVTKDVNAHQ